MKFMSPVKLVALSVAVVLIAAQANAQPLQWDPGQSTGMTLGGSGTWSSTTSWYNGLSDGPWVSGSDADFGGTAGIVTLGGAQSAGNLNFNTSGYTITGTNTLTLTGGSVTVRRGPWQRLAAPVP